jgi:hypothetical protein
MTHLNKLRALMRDMENSLGIIGDIIGAICLFILGIGLFVFVPLIAG